ncbi:MAG TPA: M13 family metallopeptidase [Acidobacteriaceae bacterium]|jgi:endothelin-converting enzyme/putative endopeptidase|nr:M13 family metallopeptidase [Acidobacteriaceae bacterium]
MNLLSARLFRPHFGAVSIVLTSALFLLVPPTFPQSTAPAKESSQVHGIAVANMDPSVKPGDNFYLYANGGWIARTQIPPDRGGLSVFSVLFDRSNKEVAGLIEEAAKSNSPAGSNNRKIADFYNAFMDESAIEARGLKPLQPHLDAIAALNNKQELARYLGTTLRADVDLLNNAVFSTPNLFGLWIAPGFSDSDHYAVYLLQGGLEMPSQSYYLDDSDRMKEIRARYEAHVAAMLKLAGFDDTDARAGRVIALEHAMAQVHVPLAEIEDIHKADNPWTRGDFASKAPGLDWDAYFEGAGLAGQQNFIVWTPTAFTGESALVASTPLATWKDWLAYHLIEDHAELLPHAVADEDFDFTGKVLGGVEQQRPRWQRAVGLVNFCLGDAVGQIYARKYFSPEAKAQAQAMVASLIAAYHKRIAAISWLAPSTRAEAQSKLNSLYIGIGYPETWRDYSAYEVHPDDAFGNFWRYEVWKYHAQIARIGKPVDRHEWSMEPQTVNAVNLPLQNALSFPAAILQPPFFDPKAPAAHNYGAIGTVIGHEISHTFDAEGSVFDSEGRLRNWWTPADHAHFEEQAQRLADQYDAYEALPGLHVNGKQTIDENIADLGGVAAAYDGYHASLHGRQAPKQDGFTGDQQFYIAFGQNWASKAREASMRRQVLTDGHSPGQFRADTVRNSDGWYKAFDVKPGEKLYLSPQNRVRIW